MLISIVFVSHFNQQTSNLIWAVSILGSSLGYLLHNLKSDYIYMGDCGSYFIGSNLALLSISGGNNINSFGDNSNLLLGFLIISIPILDMLNVIITRLKDGFSPLYPDRRHLHHRLLNLGIKKRDVLVIVYTFTIWFNSLVIAFHYLYTGLIICLSTSLFIVFKFSKYFKSKI